MRSCAQAARPPRVWLQASTATIYAHRFSSANDEETGTFGGHEEGTPALWRFPNTAVGAVTRLQAGPFTSKTEANAACATLKARGQACFVVAAR